MFVLKIMNGPQAGKTISLVKNKYILGRSNNSDIIIESNQVSKQHAQINIQNNKVYIKDLKSRNGTYINGIQIREEKLKNKDKITLHNIVIVIYKISSQTQNASFQSNGNLALANNPSIDNQISPDYATSEESSKKNKLAEKKDYLEEVVMPGLYKLTEWTEFKWFIGCLFGLLIITSTILSAIPALNLLRSSIEKESQRRALTIAKNMVAQNQRFIAQGFHSSINIDDAQQEAGVINALIVDKNGSIIAPSNQAGKHPNVPFLHSARKENKISVEQISINEIGVIIPIKNYNTNTGSQSSQAYAFVLYDMSATAINSKRTLSLYIQILFISLIIGLVFFFFIFKLFEYPFKIINIQLDNELQSNSGDIHLKFNNPFVQKLIANINTALNRTSTSSSNHMETPTLQDKSGEMSGIIQMIGFAAIAYNSNKTLGAFNPGAEELLAFSYDMIGFGTDKITDQALLLNINDLLEQSAFNQSSVVTSQLELGGEQYEIMAQAVMGIESISYYLITFIPQEES